MQIPSLRAKPLLLLMFLLLGVNLTPARGQELTQSITMAVTPAYQGYFKYGEWLPIWITLENNGPDLDGEIQVRVMRDFEQTTFAVPISLPAGARKRLPVNVLPNNFTHELKIELVSNSETLLTQTAIVHPQPNINYMIGVAANNRGALTLVPRIQLPSGRIPVPVDISLDELPERTESIRSFNSLILNDVDTSSLTPEQVSALIGWVEQGGRLVIGGGISAMQTTSGFPGDILPLVPDDLTDLDNVDALAEFANSASARAPGPFVAAIGKTQQGITLVEQSGFPIVQEIRLGEGYITFVALDLTSSPFDAWNGTTAFWEALLTPGSSYPNWLPPDMSERQLSTNPIGNALSNIPSLDLPSAKGIVFLLGIYILLVGPVNYLVLRWRNKLHWGWITIPVITLVFSAMSFGLGYAKRGTDLIINKIAIIQGQSDGSAQVTSYIGLFSPANQRYELEISGNNLLSPMLKYYNPWMSSIPPGDNNNNLTFVQGDPSQVRGLNINQWSMQSFMTEITFEEIGVINANLNMEDQRVVGLITNDTDYRLTDAVMILKQNFLRLGDIAVGESVNIEMELDYGELYGPTISWKIFENQFNPSMMGAPPREQEFKRMILEAVLDQQNYYGTRITPGETRSASELSTTIEVTIIGWINAAPPEVRIDGQVPQETATSLFKTQLNLRIPEQGKIIIPPGLIHGLVAEMPLSAGICGTESTALWIEKGEAIVEFALPPELSEVNIENLQFLFQTDGGLGNSPFIAIYNWETASWHPLEKTILGINVISDPADSISTDGFVRFKISPGNQDFGGASCIYTGLGLEGNR